MAQQEAQNTSNNFEEVNKTTNKPENLDHWTWVNCKGNYYLQSNLLKEHGFNHGHFTNQWNSKGPHELSSSIAKGRTVHFLKQIHSADVLYASMTNSNPLIAADGLVSDAINQSLWIYSADCIPIFFADRLTGRVAACHAGWRGIVSGIVSKSLKMIRRLGSDLDSLIVTMGPAISGENYQVNCDVADKILKTIEHKTPALYGREHGFDSDELEQNTFKENQTNKISIDLRQVAAAQLNKEGIETEQISICPLCTMKEKHLLYSWRRDHIKAVQWSCIANN